MFKKHVVGVDRAVRGPLESSVLPRESGGPRGGWWTVTPAFSGRPRQTGPGLQAGLGLPPGILGAAGFCNHEWRISFRRVEPMSVSVTCFCGRSEWAGGLHATQRQS